MEVSVLPRWTDPTRSENIEQLVQALALAQAKIRSPERNREVKVTPKSGGQGYSFRYATLDHIIDMVRLPLTENGLWFTQIMKLDEGTYILDTRLMHGSGQWIACQTPLLFDGGGNQQFGSALTFMRRYSLTSLLGIAAEEDDDANAADGNVINQVQDRKPIAPKPDVMKEDPISTGIKIKSGLPTNEPPGDGVAITTIQGPYKIVIGMNANQTGSDWVSFGKELIASIKESPNSEMAEMWRELNQTALGQMEKDAPKTFANLSMSIIKAINDLKKEETKA
jgi:hypothetical protein